MSDPSTAFEPLAILGLPSTQEVGIVTAIGLSIWLVTHRRAKPLTFLVSGGLKAWLDKEIFNPIQERLRVLEEQNRILEMEKASLQGELKAVKETISGHDDRLRAVERFEHEMLIEIREFREDIAADKNITTEILRLISEQASNYSRLNAQREADALSNVMIIDDLKDIRHILMTNSFKRR